MSSTQAILLAINIVGGIAVIGSYALGLWAHPGQGNELWGGVPGSLRGVYGISMLLSAVGYLLFFYHTVFRMDPPQVRLPWDLPFATFHILFVLILLPSAFWMSLTFAWLAAPSTALWIAIRTVLGLVGIGSLMMLAALASLKGLAPDQFWWPSTVGAAVFTFHTLVLDALLWPKLFAA